MIEAGTDVRKLILDIILDAPPEVTNGFYDGKKLVKAIYDLPISMAFIIGMRRIGKTELMTYVQTQLYILYGIKTAWVRSREKEFKMNYESFLNRMQARELVPPEWISKSSGVYTDSGKGAVKVIDFCYLNTSSNFRGGGHPDTYMMVLDEFQPEDLRYPPHPLQSLMSLTQTILSGKPSMCFCLSNFVSLANPYFVGMEIYPRRQDVTVFEEKGVAIERCRGYRVAIEEDNPWKRIYAAASYQSYASENEDGLLELVAPAAKGAKAADNIYYCIHGRYYRHLVDGRMNYYIRTQPPKGNALVMSPYPEDISGNIRQIRVTGYKDMMDRMLQQKAVRFQDPNTLFDLMSPCYYI